MRRPFWHASSRFATCGDDGVAKNRTVGARVSRQRARDRICSRALRTHALGKVPGGGEQRSDVAAGAETNDTHSVAVDLPCLGVLSDKLHSSPRIEQRSGMPPLHPIIQQRCMEAHSVQPTAHALALLFGPKQHPTARGDDDQSTRLAASRPKQVGDQVGSVCRLVAGTGRIRQEPIVLLSWEWHVRWPLDRVGFRTMRP
mmetsp:Transcript_79859/g.222373  ORF Transcript_79859/g.222373 Transcript_79859/m.222373 type:complete len:200 (+) Transcript_79859:468-1067(+)